MKNASGERAGTETLCKIYRRENRISDYKVINNNSSQADCDNDDDNNNSRIRQAQRLTTRRLQNCNHTNEQ